MTISETLRDELGRMPETIEEFAEKHGIDAGELSRLFRGNSDLKLETVDRIATAFGLELVRKSDALP
jgi:transcriptional regulator with XRE-family HTH domain